MKSYLKIAIYSLTIIATLPLFGQHHSKMTVEINSEKNTLGVIQELTFYNQSSDTIGTILLNDWNNSYSDKNSLLGKRFSDEFVRNFHWANAKELGNTSNITIIDGNKFILDWSRPENKCDLIQINLKQKIKPNEKVKFYLTYVIKVPSNQFTKYGYGSLGEMNLKNWFLTPARYENHNFISYSNANLDDIANGISDFDLAIKVPKSLELYSDLNEVKKSNILDYVEYHLSGKNRNDFSLFIEPKSRFHSYKNSIVDVITNIKDTKLDDIQKAIVIDRVVNYVNDNIGPYPFEKITVSQTDYERNPFYGLNQLPSFISPFSDEFLFELKFMKTFLNNYLKNTLHIDSRRDNWVIDGIQVYTMMKYIDEFHPEIKMMGSLSEYKLLKSYNLININFNEQYSYYYMLMARKNLDQPLGNTKESLIRFNEKIASKYRAGLSLKYLDNYLGENSIPNTIKEFYVSSLNKETNRFLFQNHLKKNANKNIDWFFETIIDSRNIIDYKFNSVIRTKDSITFNIKNKTGTTVPIPVYGLKDNKIVFKKWFENIKTDSTFTIEKQNTDKIVLNYKNEVPEFNLRNNWKSLKGTFYNNRPFKFNLMKDLEDPYYNQILYVPTVVYNLYDGLSPGFRFHNKTILDKPFVFDVNPIYSPNTKKLIGNFNFGVNQYIRDSRLFNIRYNLNGSYFHYAPDAAYLKINPSIQLLIRENDFRDNRKQGINFRYSIVEKERSFIVSDTVNENYSVFNMGYFNAKTELTNLVTFAFNTSLSNTFGKLTAEVQYRKLFDNNRQINLRFFAGSFLYNKDINNTSYTFGVGKPNDYLFDYNFFGRSETSGLFSQQLILAEGGFKSVIDPAYGNHWLVATNGSFNVWNWVEIYGDIGFVKNKKASEKFIYDSGIRLNLVTDYFELYLPVYSNNGWEITQNGYKEKIRFIFTFNPKSLINLFTRKWF